METQKGLLRIAQLATQLMCLRLLLLLISRHLVFVTLSFLCLVLIELMEQAESCG